MKEPKERMTVKALLEAYWKRMNLRPSEKNEDELDILEEVIRERMEQEKLTNERDY